MWGSSWSRLSVASHAHLASFTTRFTASWSIDRKSLIKSVEICNRFVTAWHVNFSYPRPLFYLHRVDIINDERCRKYVRGARGQFRDRKLFFREVAGCFCGSAMNRRTKFGQMENSTEFWLQLHLEARWIRWKSKDKKFKLRIENCARRKQQQHQFDAWRNFKWKLHENFFCCCVFHPRFIVKFLEAKKVGAK